MQRSLFLLAFATLAASTCLAQDPCKVDTQHCKVDFENAQVRVLHWKIGPKEKVPMHSHPAFVEVPLTAGKTRFTTADGKSTESESTPGKSDYSGATKHSSENLSDTPQESIQVELKSAKRASSAKKE
jgi:quercetin dioxygenase-like cupin family protein